MSAIILDTETNGFYPGQICQISYIIAGEGLAARNFYFAVEDMNPFAQRVHGLSIDMLRELSGGDTFEKHLHRISEDIAAADYVFAHNFRFDQSYLATEFNRCGCALSIKQKVCTMSRLRRYCAIPGRNGLKNPKLSELTGAFGVEHELIMSESARIFGIPARGAHDAMYDTTALYLALREACKRGLTELLGTDIA